MFTWKLVAFLTFALAAHAHIAAWNKGMYCLNGTVVGVDNSNNNAPVSPLYNLTFNEWWFHHDNLCDEFPPAEGDFLELPAGGSFTVELAPNRAYTSLSYDGEKIGIFGNGANKLVSSDYGDDGCITNPNLHTQNESMAAGTAFAISYNSNISEVTPETLVVFSVLYNSPWRRIATYDVPALPACPEGGCICAWGWVPNGCGEANMYMEGFRCNVTGNVGIAAVATAQPPVYCQDDASTLLTSLNSSVTGNTSIASSGCVEGAKQMIYWNQLDGNNVNVTGDDDQGFPRFPGYNAKLGWEDGCVPDVDVFLCD
ncbi:hypothetical protein FISHEDRAFT_64229 [Fistulina hepatica ATCC 64428]|uniref:Uncharacterized protein n=1 Tax=Fistulina hepatica ATCC 64428 TaxID=1128425 RepID=A0A0D7AL87_9AGAR|nr:hypothetical protein FISHEDRAFT_64229 [Fistulina hepatica ATCC 64428]